MDQFRVQNRVVTATELDHEQSLLEDSAKLEAHYTEKIATLDNELKSLHEVCIYIIFPKKKLNLN